MRMLLGLNKTIGWRNVNHQKNRNLSELITGTTRIWMERERQSRTIRLVIVTLVLCLLLLLSLLINVYLCNLLIISYLCALLYLFWQRFGLTCGIVKRIDGFWDADSALVGLTRPPSAPRGPKRYWCAWNPQGSAGCTHMLLIFYTWHMILILHMLLI